MDKVECMICHKKCDGYEAYLHTLETKHNRWKLLLPKKGGEMEVKDYVLVLMCVDCNHIVSINFDGLKCPKCGGHLKETKIWLGG